MIFTNRFARIKATNCGFANGKDGWCGRGELNPQGLPHSILSAARLPISPRPHIFVKTYYKTIYFSRFLCYNQKDNLLRRLK